MHLCICIYLLASSLVLTRETSKFAVRKFLPVMFTLNSVSNIILVFENRHALVK